MEEQQVQEDTPSKVTEITMPWNRLVLHQYLGSDTFELGEYIDVRWGKYMIHVPAGITTDLASRPIGDSSGIWNIAAVVHDFLYNGGEMKHRKDTHILYAPTREEADQVFLDVMMVTNVPKITRDTFYAAVVIFGADKWKGMV